MLQYLNMSNDITISRMGEAAVNTRLEDMVDKEVDSPGAIYRCCKNCGGDIPASESNHAYCDVECKKESMREEMF